MHGLGITILLLNYCKSGRKYVMGRLFKCLVKNEKALHIGKQMQITKNLNEIYDMIA